MESESGGEQVRIVAYVVVGLESYGAVPISFVIRSRLDLASLRQGEFVEVGVDPPRDKDYDALEPIATLSERFDTTNWGMLMAWSSDSESSSRSARPAGGAIIAYSTPGVDMLEGRTDLAVLWDIRVRPELRGQGIGRALFEAAAEWAKEHGCTELRVETQDTNVAACRFYSAMGCTLHSMEEGAYEGLDEAKLVWALPLQI